MKIGYDTTEFKLKRALQKNFLDTWIHYLEFNITRHRRIAKLAGTPIRALIAEVIYWHELLILAEKGTDEPFETTRRQVRAMEVAGLFQQSDVHGLLINKETEFHQKVSGELVHFEQEQIVKLIRMVEN